MQDRPDRPDGLASNVKRHEEALLRRRAERRQIGIASLEMSEHQRAIAIEHVSAGAEIARGPTPDVWTPHPGDSRPIEPLPADVRRFAIHRQQAKASRVTLSNFKDCFR